MAQHLKIEPFDFHQWINSFGFSQDIKTAFIANGMIDEKSLTDSHKFKLLMTDPRIISNPTIIPFIINAIKQIELKLLSLYQPHSEELISKRIRTKYEELSQQKKRSYVVIEITSNN